MMLLNAGPKPRAEIGRVVSQDIINKSHLLFIQNGGSIPLMIFTSLYLSRYKEILDPVELGFDDGLIGLFTLLGEMFSIKYIEGRPICYLRNTHIGQYSQDKSALDIIQESREQEEPGPKCCFSQYSRINTKAGFYDPSNLLWNEPRFKQLLSRDDILIPMSPLEYALQRDQVVVEQQIFNVHQILQRYPKGVPVSQLCRIIQIDKRLFNVPSLNVFVEHYPEVCYVQEAENQEPLVFDGTKYCHDEIEGHWKLLEKLDKHIECYSYLAIRTGLYQKTLILIKNAGPAGLRLCVWRQALKHNFTRDGRSSFERILDELSPLTIMLIFEKQNMITVRSNPNIRNDLRMFAPTSVWDMSELQARVLQLLRSFKSNSKDISNKENTSQESTLISQRVNIKRKIYGMSRSIVWETN